jgi:hypothetical protein
MPALPHRRVNGSQGDAAAGNGLVQFAAGVIYQQVFLKPLLVGVSLYLYPQPLMGVEAMVLVSVTWPVWARFAASIVMLSAVASAPDKAPFVTRISTVPVMAKDSPTHTRCPFCHFLMLASSHTNLLE